jgi:hypothetical protein
MNVNGYRLLIAATACGLFVARALAKPRTRGDDRLPEPAPAAGSFDVEHASETFLNLVLLPLWLVPGFADYWCHRASKIERTSGTHESLTHLLMISSTGAGIGAGMFFEVNELVLAILIVAALAHEAIVLWDVGYAVKLRPPSATEQHMHSFLEVLPFSALAFTMCLHPAAVANLAGRGPRPRQFRFEKKRHPVAPIHIAGITGLAIGLLFVPYTKELLRCYRVDHTLLPHHAPDNDA